MATTHFERSPLYISKKNYFFVAQKTVTIMSNTMVAVNMKIVVCIERCLFLFFGFYASFMLVNETTQKNWVG